MAADLRTTTEFYLAGIRIIVEIAASAPATAESERDFWAEGLWG
jgi:hypothetical protein